MDLESLKVFRNVVVSGGFTKAVSRCGLSQSAISKQVQALEASLGQKLIHRTTHHFELTDAGRLLYEHSERLLADFAETEQLFRNFTANPQPNLRMGTTLSIGISYFPGIFTNFSKKHPNCHLDVQVEGSSALFRSVEQLELDCAVVCLPPRIPNNIMVAKRFLDPLMLVASSEFQAEETDLSQLLEKEPLIMISRKTYTRKIIDHYLFKQGITTNPVMELDSFDLIVSFVSLGLGLSIVPQRVFPVYARSRSVTCKKIANLKLNRELGIIHHQTRKNNTMIKEFVRYFSF